MIIGHALSGGASMAGVFSRSIARASRFALVTAVVLGLAFAGPAQNVAAQEKEPSETSAVADDAAEQKTKKKKKKKKAGGASFLPIPIFITEPAIGVGLGAVPAYFHKKKGEAESEATIPRAMTTSTPRETARKKKRPPTISGIAAAYTDSGTWGAGIGHTRSNRRDSVRYSGAIGYATIKSTIYRFNIPFDFDITGGILHQDIKFRLGKSDFFLGGKLSVLAAEGEIELGFDRPIELGEGDTIDVGLAAQAIWDTRDNVMTPNQGQLVQLDIWRYDDAIGGDFDYWSLNFKVNSFHQLSERLVLGWRIDGKAVDGKPPFWGYPWVTLRGIPALRYQNERVGVVEIEGRYDLADRWGVVGFVGRGKADGDIPAFETEDKIYAGGIGGRFLFKPDENLWVGIDIARGPEDTYWYIQVGQAW
jgi:hypothetical protein